MRLLKLFGVIAATVVFYLVMLHFKVPFGIALIIALGAMWYGVKYVRNQHPESEEYAETPTQSADDAAADEVAQENLPDSEEEAE